MRIRTTSGRTRVLSVYGYVEFSFHEISCDNQNFQMSLYCAGSRYEDGAALCELHYEETSETFFASSFVPDSFYTRRDSFIRCV